MNVLPGLSLLSPSEFSTPDIQIENHFSLYLVHPFSEQARAWLEENVQADAQWFGGALVVEPRYVADLLEGMLAAGLTLACEQARAQ